jgi:cell division protein FtsI/penicillin-binding protein 2
MPMFFPIRRGRFAAGGVALAALATVVFADSPGDPPAANLTAAAPEAEAPPAIEAPATRYLGDAVLRGRLHLSRAARDGDQLRVALGDKDSAELTIVPEIQAAAEAALVEARAPMGAIVVMATDGRILALAGRRQDGKQGRRDDTLATTLWAPSASIFKIVTGAALLDAGVDPRQPVCYHRGVRSVVASNLVDDKRADDVCNDLGYAVARSQNAIIAKLAHRYLDRAKLESFARAFGYAAAPAFALDAQTGRLQLPAADDQLELARAAAGFWHSELSPLGGALLANTVASGGLRVTPRLVKAVTEDGVRRPIEPVAAERVLPIEVAHRLGRMMVATTESGTAYAGFHGRKGKLLDVAVAGKTGTLSRKDRSLPPLQYSWFVGFAPADAPKVSVAVLLGNGELWHIKAHTAARMVLQAALQ